MIAPKIIKIFFITFLFFVIGPHFVSAQDYGPTVGSDGEYLYYLTKKDCAKLYDVPNYPGPWERVPFLNPKTYECNVLFGEQGVIIIGPVYKCCRQKIRQGTDLVQNAPEPIFFTPEVGFPGFKSRIQVDGSFIGIFLEAFFQYLIYLSGIFAVMMLIIAGFQWVLAGGNESKISEAKARIQNAFIGLILCVSSVLILQTINPDLISIKPINIENIVGIPIEDAEGSADEIKMIGTAASPRRITEYIVIHTAAGIMTRDQIDDYHRKAKDINGPIGYNRYIERDGTVVDGRGDDAIGAHARGYNSKSVGVSYSGCAKYQAANQSLSLAVSKETITQAQINSLINEIKRLQEKYNIPRNKVIGHNKVVNKTCPCLDMDEIRSLINP